MGKTIRIREKTWNANFCGIGYNAMLKFQIYDQRKLPQIAPDVDGADELIWYDGEKEHIFGGYTLLKRIERIDAMAVDVYLDRDTNNEEVAS